MAGYPGKQGRKPKPTTIVENQRDQTYGADLDKLPPPPDYLSDREKAEWKRVGNQLLEVGLINGLDVTVLAAYCAAYGRWVEAQESIKKHGVLVKSPNGFPMQSPYLAISNKAMEQMVKIMGELGMTPAARTRIPKADQQKPRAKLTSCASGNDPRRMLGVVK